MIFQMMFRICKWQIYIFRCPPFMFQDANLLFPCFHRSFSAVHRFLVIVTGGVFFRDGLDTSSFGDFKDPKMPKVRHQPQDLLEVALKLQPKKNSTYFGVRKNASDIPTNFVSAEKTMIRTPFCQRSARGALAFSPADFSLTKILVDSLTFFETFWKTWNFGQRHPNWRMGSQDSVKRSCSNVPKTWGS